MTDQKQSDGREQNDASPVEDWESSGVLETKKKAAKEGRSFSPKDPNDLTGPAGDPAEGKRSDWPS